MGTIHAFWSRNVKKYLRSKTRIPMSLGQPLFFLIFLGFALSSLIVVPGIGHNYLKFIIPGVIAMAVIGIATFYGVQIVWDKQFGFLKETLIAPTSRMQIMIGQTLGGATAGLLQGIIMLIISMLAILTVPSLYGLIISLFFMFLVGIFFAALGISMGAPMEDLQAFGAVFTLVLMPIFGLSGGLFPLDKTLPFLKVIAYFNPLAYGIEGIRYGLFGVSQINPLLCALMLLFFCLIMIIVGAIIFQKMKAQTN